MADPVITNNDLGSAIVERGEFEDGPLIFAAADTFAADTIVARHTTNLSFQLYVKGGAADGNGVPVGILVNESVRSVAEGAGNNRERIMISGIVNENRLVIDADGDNSNIDATVRDLLRQTGITPIDVEQLARLDNPQPTESDS